MQVIRRQAGVKASIVVYKWLSSNLGIKLCESRLTNGSSYLMEDQFYNKKRRHLYLRCKGTSVLGMYRHPDWEACLRDVTEKWISSSLPSTLHRTLQVDLP